MNSKNVMPYVAAIIFSLIFGLSFMFTKKAIMIISVLKLLSFRFLLAFIVMSLLVFFKELSASKSTVFANFSTIISIFAGVAFLNEKFYYYHIIGSVMILVGIVGTNYFNTVTNSQSNG